MKRIFALPLHLPWLVFLLILTPSTSLAQAPKADPKKGDRIWDHQGSVLALAFSRDGSVLVTGGSARSEPIVFWDLAGGKRLRALKSDMVVYSLALSPDGKKLAGIGITGIQTDQPGVKAAIWDTASGKMLFTLKNLRSGTRPCVAFSPDGKLLATGATSGKGEKLVGAVQLWDAQTGKAGDLLIGPSETFGRLAFSADGKTLAAASFGTETFVILWDVVQRKQRSILRSKPTWEVIRSIAFSPDDKQLVLAAGNEANGNKELSVWDVASGTRSANFNIDQMLGGAFFHDHGKSLIAVGLDSFFQIWNLESRKKTAEHELDLLWPTMIQTAALSPDGKTLAIGGGNSDLLMAPDARFGSIHLIDVATGRERLSPEREAERARTEAEQEARLAAQAREKANRDAEAKQELAKLSPALRTKLERAQTATARLTYAQHLTRAKQAIDKGQFHAAKELLEKAEPRPGQEDLRGFEWHYLRKLCGYELASLEHEDKLLPWHRAPGPCLSPDGKTLVVATVDNLVTLWNVATGKERAKLKGMSGPALHVVFSADSKYVAVAGGKWQGQEEKEANPPGATEATLWEVNSGKRLAGLVGSQKAIQSVAFSADSRLLAIGDLNGAVRIWEVPAGKQIRTMKLKFAEAAALAFSPDGKTLAIAGMKGDLALWNLADGSETRGAGGSPAFPVEQAGRLHHEMLAKQGDQAFSSLQFSPDGKTLYSTGSYPPREHGDWPLMVANRWQPGKDGTWASTHEWKDVKSFAMSPDGKRLALSQWGFLDLWNTAKHEMVARLPGDLGGSTVSFSPDAKTLLVNLGDPQVPTLCLFDAADGKRRGVVENLLRHQGLLDFDRINTQLGPAGQVTIAGGSREDGKVLVMRTTLGQNSRVLDSDRGSNSLSFSPDGKLLATAGVAVLDLQSGLAREFREIHDYPTRVLFSADGKTIVSLTGGGAVIQDVETAKEIANIKGDRMASDGKLIFAPDDNGTINLYSMRDGKKIGVLSLKGAKPNPDLQQPTYYDVHLSPGGRWAIGLDCALWDVPARKEIKLWAGNFPLLFGFTPDEKTLVTTDRDRKGTTTILDLPTLKPRHVLEKSWAGLGAFSADNRTAALQTADGAICLVDLVSGEEIAVLAGLAAPVAHMMFTPDGKSLVTCSKDGPISFWCPATGAHRLTLDVTAGSEMVFSPDGTCLAISSDGLRLLSTK